MDPGSFFDLSPYPARWGCGAWPAYMGWLHIVSDIITFLAYLTIPLAIAWYVRRRGQGGEVPFTYLFWLFCAFIFSCGTVHLLEAVIFWVPIYPISGLVKAITAVVSVIAVIATLRVMPRALALPRLAIVNARLESEVAARRTSEETLREHTVALAENERRLIAAQEAGQIGDWSWDIASGRITWSAMVYRLVERQVTPGWPKDWSEALACYTLASRAHLETALIRVRTAQVASQEVIAEAQLPSGTQAWHRFTVLVMPGEPDRLWGTVQDCTKQQRTTLMLERQSQELRRINEQLEQFAYIASHDLQEPLRKVRFFAGVLHEETRGRITGDAEDAMTRISAATLRMDRLVRDLLVLARAGKSLAVRQNVRLNDAVADAQEALEKTIADSGCRIEVGDLPLISGDRTLLAQVFQNLLGNAIHYRRADLPPVIRISGGIEQERVVVRVADQGIGFPNDKAERIFEPFVRLSSAQVEGTGIGLAICKRIIEAHDGAISAVSSTGHGAVFILAFPLHTATIEAP